MELFWKHTGKCMFCCYLLLFFFSFWYLILPSLEVCCVVSVLVYSGFYWSADNLPWNFLWTFDRIVYCAESLLVLLIKTHKSSFCDTQASLRVNFSLSFTLTSYIFSEPLRSFILVPEDNTGEWNYEFIVLPMRYICRLYLHCVKPWLKCGYGSSYLPKYIQREIRNYFFLDW